MSIVLKDVRIAFPQLFTPVDSFPQEDKKPDPKYQCRLYVDGDNLKKVEEARKAAFQKKWPNKWESYLKQALDSRTTRGIQSDDHGYYISAKRRPKDGKPVVIDRAKRQLSEDDGVIYAGCYVNASITCFAYDRSGNRGCSFGLNGIQYVREGEAFGGATPSTADDFSVIEEEDEVNPFS